MSQEYSWYIDSHNREKKLEVKNNPTNDIYIPMKFPRKKLPVAQITLGSLELPLSQYTIEQDWSNMYFDEGLNLIVPSQQNESLIQFVIDENGTEVVGQLPPKLNPIIDISPNPSDAPIFTTLFPHMLNLRSFYNWGESIEVVSTPIVDTSFTKLDSNNLNLRIISDTQFQILNLPGPVTFSPVTGLYGYVKSPTIPNPEYLATLVNASLDLESPNHWRVTYNKYNGKFKLKWIGSVCEAKDAYPATLIISTTNSLPSIMGFGNVNLPIPLPQPESKEFKTDFQLIKSTLVPEYKELCLTAHNCYTCKSSITIDKGNYNPNELGANITRQLNRFYFDPGCYDPSTMASPPNIELIYSDNCGACQTVVIPYGMYTPDTLAEYIQTQITPTIPSMVVEWNDTTGQFCFSADEMFGLEFDISNTDLIMRLGFMPVCYRNESTYKSPKPFQVPIKGCCASSIPNQFLSYTYSVLLLSTERKYEIQVCKTRCLNSVTASNNGDGTMTLTTQYGNPVANIAHGYQPNDIIDITNAGGDTYSLMVVSVESYNQFTVEIGSVLFSEFAGTLCTCLNGVISGNLYFAQECRLENPIMPFVLGFLPEDFLWQPGQTSFVSSSCFNLDWPNYLLIEITDPDGGTNNNHNWDEDNKPRVFGKVILYPQYRMERMFPIRMNLPDLRTVSRMKFRFLNPDHTLYKFHGRDWSMTLVMVSLEQSVKLTSY